MNFEYITELSNTSHAFGYTGWDVSKRRRMYKREYIEIYQRGDWRFRHRGGMYPRGEDGSKRRIRMYQREGVIYSRMDL